MADLDLYVVSSPLQLTTGHRQLTIEELCPKKGNQNDLNRDPFVPVDLQNRRKYLSSIKKTTDRTPEF